MLDEIYIFMWSYPYDLKLNNNLWSVKCGKYLLLFYGLYLLTWFIVSNCFSLLLWFCVLLIRKGFPVIKE